MPLIDADELKKWLKSPVGFRANCEDCTSTDCLNCIIEEAIENAPTVEAVVLPCRIGDTVYRTVILHWAGKTHFMLYQYTVSGFHIRWDGNLNIRLTDSSGGHEITRRDLGHGYYLDEGEAQKALEELKGPNGKDLEE